MDRQLLTTKATASARKAPALRAADQLPIGAHLVTPRFGYTHHGIYIGAGRVVHYAGWSQMLLRGPVEEVTCAEFADGHEVFVEVETRPAYAPHEVVARARSRLGEDRYRLATNNCEHFCAWCRSGVSRSAQVEKLRAWLLGPARAVARLGETLLAAGTRAAASRPVRDAWVTVRA